jgi:TP901 family phage tail tape measure protein
LADQNIVTNITATANFSSLTAQLQAVTSQLLKLQTTTIGLNKNLTSQVGVMNRQFDETMRSTGQFARHFVTLTSDVSKFGHNLDSGRMKLGQYFRTWQGHTQKTSTLVRDLAKQQVMLENAVIQPLGKNAQGLMQYNVMVQSGLDVTKNKSALLRQELSIMNKVMMDGSNQLINWGKNTQWAGRQLTVGLTVPIAAFGMAAAKAFKEADTELVRLQKVYGGLTATSSADLLQVRKDVMALSRELASGLGANFKETIGLAADIAATGKEGADLLDATRQTTRLAILGEVDRQEAMKATLSIQTAFGKNTEELAESIDLLNAVENQTSTTLDDLVTAIPKAGPVVKALGGDIQDLALYLTAMREGGINAAEGANAIKSSLASLINPTKVAKDMFMGFGIDLVGIVDKNAGNLTGTIMALKDSLDSLEPLQRARAIEQLFGKFQFARINALFENLGKEGSQTLQVLDLMKASTQDLAAISARELTALTESASGKYRRALEAVKADLAVVGEQFLKVGAFVLNAIDGIVKFIGNLPGPIKAVLGFIGSLTAIAGPIIMLTGVLANFFGYIIKGIFALKSIGKGGTGFKLLTPEIMAAESAAKNVEQAFYSDTKAAATFSDAVLTLAASFEKLKQSAMSSTVATSNSMSTVAGNPVMGIGGRIVDKNNPLVGKAYSRDMSHLNPTGSKTADQRASETIFSTVPGPKPVNLRLSNSPQTYMNNDLPRIPGVTSVNGVSNGVVAAEAAKWHSMTAAIAMQSQAEIALLKTEVAATGTVTASLADSYQALLPQMTKITTLAAEETALIVKQLQAGKVTVEAARAKILALNAQVEAMMVQTAKGVAVAQARSISLTTVPLTNQPVVNALGKSNMKELFHKSETSKLVDSIARDLGVRTSGAGYSIQTTKPRFNAGGKIENFGQNKTQVSGPASINYDDRLGSIPLGGYVLNQEASMDPANAQLVAAAPSTHKNSGGNITALLTPKETVFGPGIKNNPELFAAVDAANNGSRIQLSSTGGVINPRQMNYGITNPRIAFAQLARAFISNKSGLTKSEKVNVLLASARLTGKRPATKWPASVERAHMVEGKPVTVQSKDYTYHPGVMFMQGRKINQATKSSGKGATGLEVVKDFEAMTKKGLHPGSLLARNASQLGYGKGDKAIKDAYEEIIATLSSKKYAQATLGGRNGIATLESITEPILKKHLSKILGGDKLSPSVESGRTLWNDVYHQGGIRGRTGKTEDVVDLMGYNLGGMIGGQVRAGKYNYGVIGNVLKGVAMRRIGAGFGPTGAPKPSMYESAPWGVNSLSIEAANTLFANSGLRKHTQKLFYDKFAAAMAKEKPYGYVKDAGGSLRNALEPTSLDAVIRSAASDLIADRNLIRQLSPIDKDILRNKYLNWDSKKNTPMTAELQKKIFGIDGKREMGGPVSPGQNYVVGEKGPEIFSPSQSGKIIPGYEVGGVIRYGKDSYGLSGNPAKRAEQLAEKAARAEAAKSSRGQRSFPYAPGLKLPLQSANAAIDSTFSSMAGALRVGSNNLVTGTRMIKGQIQYSLQQMVTGAKLYGSSVSSAAKAIASSYKRGGSEILQYGRPGAMAAGVGRSYGPATDASAVTRAGTAFATNARYSSAALMHPIQYLKTKGIGASIGNRDANGNYTFGQGGVGGMVGMMGGMAAGGAIGGKLAGQNGAMMGSMAGMMGGSAITKGIGGMIAKRAAASAATAGLASAGFGVTAAAAAGLVAPLAAVTIAGIAGYKMWKNYKEGQDLNISTFGLTAEAAKKANLRFTDFGAKIKETIQDAKDMAAANKLVYESMKDGGTPFQMTIAEYKKLKVEVRKTFGEQIKALDRQPSNKVPDAVRRIKEQLIAAGMSAEEATKKVYTMLQLSNKKDQSITATMGNKDFKNITDAQTAAVSSVTSFGKDTRDQGKKEKAASLNTALMATETGINDLIAKRERLVAKDLTGKTKSLSFAEAEKIMIDQINKSREAGTRITQETVDEMAKTNPEVKKMINSSDTVVSVWQKIRLQAQGFTGDLSKLNAQQTKLIANAFSAISTSVVSTNREGILKDQYSALSELEDKIKSYTKALKGQTAAQQISDRDKLAALNKQVEANNKLAEARKKALTAAQADADLGREIEKTRMQMQNAAASGDTQKAQELRLDLESLTSQQQTESQSKAIDKANEAANAPLKAAIEAMSNKQKKLADSAALAGDSLDKIKDKYDKQLAAIDKVNNSMTALYANAKYAGVSIEDYVKKNKAAAAALVADYEAATGNKMDRYTEYSNYEGGKVVTNKIPVSPQANALSVLAKAGTGSAVNDALAKSIKGGANLKDIVDAVKGVGGNPTLRKNIPVSGDYSNSMEEKTFDGKKIKVLNAEAREKIASRLDLQLKESFIWNKQKYARSQANGNIVYVGAAAKGVMGSSGMFLVGENGPEMVHLKNRANIMPNDVMNTIAAASPRYNFNKAQYSLKDGTTSSNSYVVNQNIYASEGMDVEALSNMIVKKAEVVIGQKAKINVKMIGQGKNI